MDDYTDGMQITFKDTLMLISVVFEIMLPIILLYSLVLVSVVGLILLIL